MLRTILTLVMIFLVYFISNNIVITLVGSIAVILILKSLEPYLLALENKLFPRPDIKILREINSCEEPGRGLRVMVTTQHNEFDASDALSMQLYDSIVAEAVEKLREAKPLFDLRYSAVLDRSLPISYSFSVCGEKDSGMRRCYAAWLKSISDKDFGVWKENSELFLHDGLFDDPKTGEPRSSLVMFMFDSRLPKTIAKPADENGESPQQ